MPNPPNLTSEAPSRLAVHGDHSCPTHGPYNCGTLDCRVQYEYSCPTCLRPAVHAIVAGETGEPISLLRAAELTLMWLEISSKYRGSNLAPIGPLRDAIARARAPVVDDDARLAEIRERYKKIPKIGYLTTALSTLQGGDECVELLTDDINFLLSLLNKGR